MTPVLSTVLIVLNLIIFFTFVTIKLDDTIDWNWFIIFVPVFFIKTVLFLDTLVLILKNRRKFKFSNKLLKLILFLTSIMLVFLFEILLCLNLEQYTQIKYIFIFLPLWLVFLLLSIYFFQILLTELVV